MVFPNQPMQKGKRLLSGRIIIFLAIFSESNFTVKFSRENPKHRFVCNPSSQFPFQRSFPFLFSSSWIMTVSGPYSIPSQKVNIFLCDGSFRVYPLIFSDECELIAVAFCILLLEVRGFGDGIKFVAEFVRLLRK